MQKEKNTETSLGPYTVIIQLVGKLDSNPILNKILFETWAFLILETQLLNMEMQTTKSD